MTRTHSVLCFLCHKTFQFRTQFTEHMTSEHKASSNIELSLAVSLLKETVIQAIVSQQVKEVKTEVNGKSVDQKREDDYYNVMVTNSIKDNNSDDNEELRVDVKRWRSEANCNCIELCSQNCGNSTNNKDNKFSAEIEANALDDIKDVSTKRENKNLELEVDALKEENQKLKEELAEVVADCQFLSNQVKDELICVKREKELLKLEVNALKEGRGELKGELEETITDCESLAKIIKEKKDLIEGNEAGERFDTAVNHFDKQNKPAVPRVGAVKRKVVPDKAAPGLALKKKKVCKVGFGCLGCSTPECGECAPCLDRPSRGGGNTLRQRCKLRRCRAGREEMSASRYQPATPPAGEVTKVSGEEPAVWGKGEERNSCIRVLDF